MEPARVGRVRLGRIELTPGLLSVSFGVFLIALAGAAGFYVPRETREMTGAAGVSISEKRATAPTATPVSAVAPSGSPVSLSPTAMPSRTSAPSSTAAPSPTAAVTAVKLPTPTATPAPTTYVVKPGDTLSGIADRFGISTSALLQANGMRDPDKLAEGDRLVIPTSSPAAASTPAPTIYVVKPGDTLSEIADRFGISASALLQANGMSDPDKLGEGDRLVIPGR